MNSKKERVTKNTFSSGVTAKKPASKTLSPILNVEYEVRGLKRDEIKDGAKKFICPLLPTKVCGL